MSSFRIVCTTQTPSGNHPNGRIVKVGIGSDPDAASEQKTVAEVLAAMSNGHSFYTKGKASGQIALVESYWCSPCGAQHIRTQSDAVTDNNLDSLRACNWRS